MARYRLRFLLQEFDLPPGETILGRSPECHVSIEDPLVSRQHAKVRIDGEEAVVDDMGSRNGLRVNGRPVKGTTVLADGDRIRIGTQELVFCRVTSAGDAASKRTGFLRHCASCRTPYPEEMVTCPSCGSTDAADEETLSGMFGESRQNWTLQLLVEVLEKALSLGRDGDAERILRRATANVDERFATHAAVEKRQLDALAEAASRVVETTKSAVWARWMLVSYTHLTEVPPVSVVTRIASLPPPERARLSGFVGAFLKAIHERGGTMNDEEVASLTRLEELRREVEGLAPCASGCATSSTTSSSRPDNSSSAAAPSVSSRSTIRSCRANTRAWSSPTTRSSSKTWGAATACWSAAPRSMAAGAWKTASGSRWGARKWWSPPQLLNYAPDRFRLCHGFAHPSRLAA